MGAGFGVSTTSARNLAGHLEYEGPNLANTVAWRRRRVFSIEVATGGFASRKMGEEAFRIPLTRKASRLSEVIIPSLAVPVDESDSSGLRLGS